jgi:charged multivesicular body protein 2A
MVTKIISCFLLFLQLVKAPSAAVAQPAAAGKVAQAESAGGNGDGGIDADLQARLDNLRRM